VPKVGVEQGIDHETPDKELTLANRLSSIGVMLQRDGNT
jgi:hypothetical protein